MSTRRTSVIAGLACLFLVAIPAVAQLTNWYMAGANPQRTSRVPEQITGNLGVDWYRPIDPYIPQNVDIVASGDKIYVSTARGVYCLRTTNGDSVWTYPTEMPLGHSPTVVDGVVYVGGFDRKLHAINADTGASLWKWGDAGAGFHTNPLVVNGKVILGSRDGKLYAIGAHGTPQQGQKIWEYTAGGPINFSCAYNSGVIYFAAMDLKCYAVNEAGQQVWVSPRLGHVQNFQSWWPVVWRDKIVLVSSSFATGGEYGSIYTSDTGPEDIGPRGNVSGDWAPGSATIDMTRAIEHYQANPAWRMVTILNASDGQEYTYQHNGSPAYMPATWSGMTRNGVRTPPTVGTETNPVLYMPINYTSPDTNIRGQVLGWTPGSIYMSIPRPSGDNAHDEPMRATGGGNLLYWTLCCDREMGGFSRIPGGGAWQYVNYNLGSSLAPGYDMMWVLKGGTAWVWGNYRSHNSIYHNHTSDQNALVVHQGRLFTHRSNCVVAFAPNSPTTDQQTLLDTVDVSDSHTALPVATVHARLEAQIQKMLDAGRLRPGYFQGGQWGDRPAWDGYLSDYFRHPHDTIWALVRALPHLPPAMQTQLRTYLQDRWNECPPTDYAGIPWNVGAKRENFDLPPEIQAEKNAIGAETSDSCAHWSFPPFAFYAMWKYAQAGLGDPLTIYNAAKAKLDTTPPTDAELEEFPYINNAYIAGYHGYLQLEALAGQPKTVSVETEMNRLRALRASTFSAETPWTANEASHMKRMSVFRNFKYLTPELASYLRTQVLSTVQDAIEVTEENSPYWFVTQYEGCLQESTIQNPHDFNAVFQARAWILQNSNTELDKFLDVPFFPTGDLYYIQQLCTLIESVEGAPNYPPVAAGDRYDEVLQNTPYMATAPGVLVNDMDPEALPLSVVLPIVDQPDHGTLSINANGSFTYTPAAGYIGPDSFQYKCSDGAIQSDVITVNITVIPPGALWQNGDIGAVGAAGSLVKDQGTFTIQASGADIYGTADEFHYVYRQMEGDGEVIVRVASMTKPNNWSRGGPMIRQSLAANSRHVNLAVTGTGGSGIFWTSRLTDGASSARTITASIIAPKFLKIVRQGNNFTAWYSDTGEAGTWTQYDSLVTVSMTDPIYVGMAVTSRQDGTLCTAVIDNVTAPYIGGGGTPVVTVTASDASAGEPSNDGQFTVTRSGSTTGSLVVNVTKTGTATNGSDYASIGTTVTIPNGQASVNVLVDVTNDSSVEGTETCILTATSGGGYTVGSPSNATVNITDDDAANQAPVASNDTYSNVVEDTTYVVNAPGVLGNDTDPDGNPITAIKVSDPAHGSVTVNSNGSFTYTPAANYNGADSFTYKANDGSLDSNTVTVNLTVGAVNDAPTAAADSGYTVNQDSYVTISAPGVLANDTDIDSGSITATNASNPPHGSVTLNTNGSFTYTPDAGYSGPDSFTYQAYDGAAYSTAATVSITVNQGGTSQTLYSTADTFVSSSSPTTNEGTGVSLQVRYTGAAVQRQSYVQYNLSGIGFTINGATLRVYQTGTATDSVTVDVYAAAGSWVENTITWSNQPGTTGGSLGNFATRTTAQGAGWIDVTLTASAIEAMRTGNNYGFVLVPRSGGTTSTITFSSREGTNDPQLVLTGAGGGGNQDPVAASDSYNATEDQTLVVNAATGVLANDTDPDSDPLTVSQVTDNVDHGSLTLNTDGSFTYTPTANWNGSDAFTYEVSDGQGGLDTAVATLTVNPVNDAPTATGEIYSNVVEDTTYVVNAPGVLSNDTDPDGNPITAIKVSDPSHGTLTLNSNGSFTYTPTANYNGADSFTYKANDGSLDSNTVTVNLTIGAVNDAPTAVADSGYSVNQNSYVTISAPGVLANDTDIDSPTITAVKVANPGHGSVTVNSNGGFTYTPTGGYSGPDSFTYKANDGSLDSNTVSVSITVNPVASSVDLSPSQDSYIINNNGTNYGTIVRTQVNTIAPPGNYRAALSQFTINTGNVPGTVTAVQIRLYTENSPTGTLTFNVYANTASWTETGVTGNNEPAEGTLIGTATSPSGTSPQLCTVDLNAAGIALVEQWRTGTASNYGITIRGTSGSTHYFHSREATIEANRPIFRITYQP